MTFADKPMRVLVITFSTWLLLAGGNTYAQEPSFFKHLGDALDVLFFYDSDADTADQIRRYKEAMDRRLEERRKFLKDVEKAREESRAREQRRQEEAWEQQQQALKRQREFEEEARTRQIEEDLRRRSEGDYGGLDKVGELLDDDTARIARAAMEAREKAKQGLIDKAESERLNEELRRRFREDEERRAALPPVEPPVVPPVVPPVTNGSVPARTNASTAAFDSNGNTKVDGFDLPSGATSTDAQGRTVRARDAASLRDQATSGAVAFNPANVALGIEESFVNAAAAAFKQFFDPREGYRDTPATLTGIIAYNFLAATPPIDNLGRTGTFNGATLSANFTTSRASASVDFTIAGQQWLINGTDMAFGPRFSLASAPALSGVANNGMTVTKVGCATCVMFGSFSGGFVEQNYAGALLGYSLGEMSSLGGVTAYTVNGGAAFERSTVIANGAPNPTGVSYLLLDGQLFDATAVLTSAGGALTGFTRPNGVTTVVTTVNGTPPATSSTLGGAINYGTLDPASTFDRTITTPLAAGSAIAVYSTTLATASNLVPALTGQATYTLAGSTPPTSSAGVAGTLNSASLAVDFSKQTFSTALNATFAADTYAISTSSGRLGQNGELSYSSSGSDLTATKNGANLPPQPTLRLSGALGGDTLASAGYAYAFGGGGFAFNGSVNFTGPAQPLASTAFRDVLTSTYLSSFGGQPTVSGMPNPDSAVPVNAQGYITSYISPIDPRTFASAPTVVSTTGATTFFNDTGSDPVTGMIWGRLSGQFTAQDRAQTAAASPALPPSYVHYIAPAAATAPVSYPQTGVFNYTNVGATTPSDNLGNLGTLNSATLQADFTNLRVAATVNATVSGTTLNGTTTDARITNAGFAASTGAVVGNLAVTCTGTCGTLNKGALQGAFTGAGAIGAAVAYGLNTAGTGGLNKVISGVAAFRR